MIVIQGQYGLRCGVPSGSAFAIGGQRRHSVFLRTWLGLELVAASGFVFSSFLVSDSSLGLFQLGITFLETLALQG